MPVTAASNSGQHAALAERRSRSPSPARPGNSTPSMRAGEVDHHAIARLRAVARPATHVARCLRSTSSVRSTSAGVDLDLRPLDRGPPKGRRRRPRDRPRRSPRTRARPSGALSCFGRGLDARIAGDAQVLLAHRVVEARLDGVGDDVGAHLRPVLLRDHLERHVARAGSPAILTVFARLREALVDLAFDLLRSGPRRSSAARADRGSPEWFACSGNPC